VVKENIDADVTISKHIKKLIFFISVYFYRNNLCLSSIIFANTGVGKACPQFKGFVEILQVIK
jgi:hypothetical protein